jgi:adsorption protein B
MALLADGDGIAFDVQSLTEDYDIGIRLRAKGLKEIFVRFPVVGDPRTANRSTAFGMSPREASVICVREYFPNTMSTAVRQKSRWIIGIVYQGFKNHKWTASPAVNYFLWRDRKGGVSNFVSFLSTLIFLQLTALYVYQLLVTDAYRFLSIFEGDRWLTTLLAANFFLMMNRMLQRAFFVTTYYGLFEGLLSAPRLVWGNLINFMANWRAIRQVIKQGDPRRVAWDKTTHDFPSLGEASRARRPLGEILVEQGAVDQAQLDHALQHRARGLKLGSWLVHDGLISGAQLAAAVAAQSGVTWEDADLLTVDESLIRQVPAEVALHYAVLPLREDAGTLVLASEAYIDPVSIAALARKVKRPVSYVIVPKGHVTVGLRQWHARRPGDGRQLLEAAVASGRISRHRAEGLWQEFVSRQVLFAEVLMSLGHLDAAALSAALLRHERSSVSLGQYMVDQDMISRDVLQEALDLQVQLQGTMDDLLDREYRTSGRVTTLEAAAV